MHLRFVFSTLVLIATGCGGGVPLLHGAHVLAPGVVRFAAGMSAAALGGDTSAAVAAERSASASASPLGGETERRRARAAAAVVGARPGTAPFAAARVGIAGRNEGGIAYTGRDLRADLRHAFGEGPLTFSAGVGVSGWIVSGNGDFVGIPSLTYDTRSVGADVPLLVGWESDGEIVSLWGGARGGYRKITGSVRLGDSDDSTNLDDWHLGGVLGFAVGFRHLHGMLELEIDYHRLDGKAAGGEVSLSGPVITPAGALAVTF